MSKEKTAMQMLIEWVEKDLKLLGYEHEQILVKANLLLQKEQEQIEKAFDDGFVDGVDSKYGCSTKYDESKDYYQYKYGGER